MIGFIIGLLGTIFWIWMLIHALTNKGISGGEKVAWVLVVIFVPLLGSIIYFFLGRPKGSSSVGV
jgi:hypothetical protein